MFLNELLQILNHFLFLEPKKGVYHFGRAVYIVEVFDVVFDFKVRFLEPHGLGLGPLPNFQEVVLDVLEEVVEEEENEEVDENEDVAAEIIERNVSEAEANIDAPNDHGDSSTDYD